MVIYSRNSLSWAAALLLLAARVAVDAATLKLPTTTGLAGGWQVDFRDIVSGARFIHPINTDKDGSIVASRVSSALGGLGFPATSDTRRLMLNPTRMSDSSYIDDAAAYVVNQLYGTLGQAGTNPLLKKTTVVLTSVHRYGLYVAEALHAQVLPLQFISFADSWAQVLNASRRATVIVGQDYDFGGLWLWNKIAAGKPGTSAATLPPAYVTALTAATNVVVVQPCDNWVYCDPVADPNGWNCWDAVNETYTGGPVGNVYLHTSLTRSGSGTGGTLYNAAKAAGRIGKANKTEVKNLKQWEWGVPDSTVANLLSFWTNSLKRPATSFKVISGGVVDMFAWTPQLWQSYLSANNLTARGFHWNSYWVAHTALERAAAVLPFPSYSYYQPSWHPLDDAARQILGATRGAPNLAALAPNSRAFVNNIGSAGDVEAVKAVMRAFNITPTTGLAFFGHGLDCSDASLPVGWDGGSLSAGRLGYVEAAIALQNKTRSPYISRTWIPLTFGSFASAPSTCGAWTQY